MLRDIPETLAKTLKLRAAEHGVSAEEEHRRILQQALAGAVDEKRNLFDHIRQFGDIAPDFEFGRDDRNWQRREVEL